MKKLFAIMIVIITLFNESLLTTNVPGSQEQREKHVIITIIIANNFFILKPPFTKSLLLLYYTTKLKQINSLFKQINNWTAPHKTKRGIKWTIYFWPIKTKKACRFNHFRRKCISSDTKWLNIINAEHCISSLRSFNTR